jgi:hypothetical protein
VSLALVIAGLLLGVVLLIAMLPSPRHSRRTPAAD